MRRIFVIPVAFVVALAGLNACSDSNSAANRAARKAADAEAITNLEVLFHRAVSVKEIDTMTSLWAENAVLTIGGQTYTGRDEIRNFWAATAAPFKPENHWVSLTPAYKLRLSSNGDRGTLYFECHYIDVDKKAIVANISADVKVSRLNGQWVFTNVTMAPAVLS